MAPLLPLQIWPRIIVDSGDVSDCRCSLSLLTRENTTSTNALQTPASAAICAATACAIQNFAASRRWACRCCRWRCTLEGFRAVCLQLPAQKMQSGWPQGRFSSMGHHHHHPTLLWCIACACLFPGCFPMAGSRRPSVGVSIALRIFSAGRRWWVCIIVILWRCDGKGRRTTPCSQGAKAAAPEALLAGMATDGVIIPGMPHGQPRPCHQQAI